MDFSGGLAVGLDSDAASTTLPELASSGLEDRTMRSTVMSPVKVCRQTCRDTTTLGPTASTVDRMENWASLGETVLA